MRERDRWKIPGRDRDGGEEKGKDGGWGGG